MTPRRFVAEPFFDPGSEELRFLPEGPRVLQNYPEAGRRLGWVAIQHAADSTAGSVNVLDLESRQNRTIALPGRPGFFAETTDPGIVLVGLEQRFAYLDLKSGNLEETDIVVSEDERVIINDGIAIDGGVLFGTKHLQFNEPIAALYYLDIATRRVHTVLGGQFCSNGKFLRRDAEQVTLVDIDSIPKTIHQYRLDSRLEHLFDQRLITSPEALPAFPDGLRPVPEGGEGESVIVAFYNPDTVADGAAWQIRVADGAVLCEWIIPGSPRVTCPEFALVGGKVKLLFTTAVEAMPETTRRIAPGAGCIYVAETPFDRLPASPPLLAR